MKLLILSDEHGDSLSLDAVLEHNRDIDTLIFLGDGMRDIETLTQERPDLRVYAARGNCDYASYAPVDGLAPFGGVLFYYTHGHIYNVKSTLDKLAAAASARGAQVALFGHTHQRACCRIGDVWLFNPGALSRFEYGGYYGIITIENGTPRFEHHSLDEEKPKTSAGPF